MLCHIVGAVPADFNIVKKNGDIIIAADGGLDSLLKARIYPDVFLGDMDSVQAEAAPKHTEIIKLPVEKDDTDTALAVEYALGLGYTEFMIYGCIGGGFDHTLGNMAVLKGLAKRGYTALFIDGEHGITAFSESSIKFGVEASGRLSVFSFTDECMGVDIKGLKYETDKIVLPSDVTLGIGNEFNGNEAEVSVKSGVIGVYTSVRNFLECSNLFDN